MPTERQDKSPAVVATELTLTMVDKVDHWKAVTGFGEALDRVCEAYEKFYLKAKQLEEAEEVK